MAETRVGVVDAVAEPIDPQRPGSRLVAMHIQAGTVIGGIDALETAVAAALHQAAEVGQLLVAKSSSGAAQSRPMTSNLHDSSDSPSIAGPLGTPSADRIVGAMSIKLGAVGAERPVHQQHARHQRRIDRCGRRDQRLRVILEQSRRAPRPAAVLHDAR